LTDLAHHDVVLRRNPEVIAKRLDQTTVLVDISTGRIFELNETGTRVWEMLGQGLDAECIVQHLVREFNVTDALAGDEVNNLIMRLRDEGLLTS
jgi:hypothetical protein